METVYIETSIPSVYFERRTQPKIVARREWTRSWWDGHRHEFRLVTGVPVFDELSRGNHPDKKEKIGLLDGLEVLSATEAIAEIVEAYLNRLVMPREPATDALHLALASLYKCDILLTWNCKHLANLNKTDHIRRVNTILGLHVPRIGTPLELLGEE